MGSLNSNWLQWSPYSSEPEACFLLVKRGDEREVEDRNLPEPPESFSLIGSEGLTVQLRREWLFHAAFLMWCHALARCHTNRSGCYQWFAFHITGSTEVKAASGVELVSISGKLLFWAPGLSAEANWPRQSIWGRVPTWQAPDLSALLLVHCLFKRLPGTWSHPEKSVCFYTISSSWMVSLPKLQQPCPPHPAVYLTQVPFILIFLSKYLTKK